jgi:predicted nucleic acid-binding protein
LILVDSNVLIDLLQDDPVWATWSERALAQALGNDRLAINPVIFAELASNFDRVDELKSYLAAVPILMKPITEEIAFVAGQVFVSYRKNKGKQSNVLADFFIGAHAQISGYALLTRDVARYQTYFPTVRLISPVTTAV